MSMFDRLEDTLRRYEDVTAELGNPDIVNDQEKFRKYMKEQSNLAPIVEAYTEYKASKQNIEDSLQMISEESDEELLEMAREELADSKKKVEELEKKLKILLLPKDPNDDKDIVVEIRVGAGGEEAALFAAELFRMYSHYADTKGWKIEVVNADETGIGGMKEVEFMVKGQGAYSVMKYESGVHRVQRVPVTESNGRIQTSTASVAVMLRRIAALQRLRPLCRQDEEHARRIPLSADQRRHQMGSCGTGSMGCDRPGHVQPVRGQYTDQSVQERRCIVSESHVRQLEQRNDLGMVVPDDQGLRILRPHRRADRPGHAAQRTGNTGCPRRIRRHRPVAQADRHLSHVGNRTLPGYRLPGPERPVETDRRSPIGIPGNGIHRKLQAAGRRRLGPRFQGAQQLRRTRSALLRLPGPQRILLA